MLVKDKNNIQRIEDDLYLYALMRNMMMHHSNQNHLENFQDLIKDLTRLRRQATIDNDTFEKLVKGITSSFIEYELSDYFERVLQKTKVQQLISDIYLKEITS